MTAPEPPVEERRPSRSSEAFFGRRQGKAIRPHQAAALAAGLSRYGIDLEQKAPASLAALFAAPVSSVRLEIGFGGGEHLLHEAKAAPSTGFIGVEPFVNGMAKLMTAVEREPLANLRVYDDDQRLASGIVHMIRNGLQGNVGHLRGRARSFTTASSAGAGSPL